MREALKGVVLLLAALFLFSVITPEPDYVQGHQSAAGFPTFVESDSAYALCSSPTVTIECPIQLGDLPLVEQVCFVPTLTVLSHLYRGPPLSFLS